MENKDKKTISGFSKLSKRGKIRWIVENFFKDPEIVMKELVSYWHVDTQQQDVLDGFSENTISNFPLPFGVAPNFLIDGKTYAVPMVIEESSVVAAASAGAKFWLKRGGFKTEILGTKKVGHVHFNAHISWDRLRAVWSDLRVFLSEGIESLTASMEERGGGVCNMQLKNFSSEIDDYYQLFVEFETCDSMGANFINTVLEEFGILLEEYFRTSEELNSEERSIHIVMAILSNYTPDCIVRATVSCPISELRSNAIQEPEQFARDFHQAIQIAQVDPYRASTHNKGIFNGVDAVVIATGNDFRAVESGGHTYAARYGRYTSLSECRLKDGQFVFSLTLPLAIGTVGGLTALHPIAKRSLELLGNPKATELMSIIASVGLAQNFSAVRSLVTTGIQKGHMKMHLLNILHHLKAGEDEVQAATYYFNDKVVSFTAVRNYLNTIQEH